MDHKYEVLTHCRLCGRGDSLKMVADLGRQPLANTLLPSSGTPVERYPLQLMICMRCYLGQLAVAVDPELVFGGRYPFQAGLSKAWREHCKTISSLSACLKEGDWVVDIGSNDGTLLNTIKEMRNGVLVLGVEPANMRKNYPCINSFWNMDTAKAVKYAAGGGPKLITATNVLAHTPNLGEFLRAVDHCLPDDGVFYFEVPNLRNLLVGCQYNTIYHEHYSYFSLQSVLTLLANWFLYPRHIGSYQIHGGSFGVWCEKRFDHIMFPEAAWQFVKPHHFEHFQERVKERDARIGEMVSKAKGRVYGYGASAKATVTLGVGKEWSAKIGGVFDDSPTKQGMWLPTNPPIPILHPDRIKEVKPDHILIFSPNIEGELRARARAEGFTGEFI